MPATLITRVEPAVLVDQLLEQRRGPPSPSVTETRRRPGRAAGGDDAPGGRLLGRGQLLGAVEATRAGPR